MSREGDWICCSCEHLNFKKRDWCQRRRYPKFGGGTDVPSCGINRTEILAGDWYCNVIDCGAHNYATRTSCYRCVESKDGHFGHGGGLMGKFGYANDGTGLLGWKSADWICTRFEYGVHNYASGMECFACKTTRDFGVAN